MCLRMEEGLVPPCVPSNAIASECLDQIPFWLACRHLQALQASHSPVAEQVQLSGSSVPFGMLSASNLSKLTGAAGSRASIAESAGAAVALG